MNKENTYSEHVKCTNCNYQTSHPTEMAEIDKGVTFEHWCIHNKCPKCGCTTLIQNHD